MSIDFNIENFITDLYKLSREFRRQSHLADDYAEISALQLHTLVFIKESEQPSMSKVSRFLGIALPTTTKLVNRLVAQKILERVADPRDRRIIKISLTKQGLETLHRFKRKKMAHLEKFLALLSADERKTLHSIISKLLTAVEKTK